MIEGVHEVVDDHEWWLRVRVVLVRGLRWD